MVAFNRHPSTVPSTDASADAEVLLSEADMAVYRAKARGRGRLDVFSEALGFELTHRDPLQAPISDAIQHDELVLFHQPIVRVDTGHIDGYEALVRWQRPRGTSCCYRLSSSVAETSDLICSLDCWVLNATACQLEIWNREQESPELIISVNISGRHINAPRIVQDVTMVLRGHAIAPRQLIIEITETVLVEDPHAVGNLNALRQLGISLSLDDFRTGYNSLAQLARLPVHMIKIDRSYLDTSTPETRRGAPAHGPRRAHLRTSRRGRRRRRQ